LGLDEIRVIDSVLAVGPMHFTPAGFPIGHYALCGFFSIAYRRIFEVVPQVDDLSDAVGAIFAGAGPVGAVDE
jgi:hypothetical protein